MRVAVPLPMPHQNDAFGPFFPTQIDFYVVRVQFGGHPVDATIRGQRTKHRARPTQTPKHTARDGSTKRHWGGTMVDTTTPLLWTGPLYSVLVFVCCTRFGSFGLLKKAEKAGLEVIPKKLCSLGQKLEKVYT